eukprot:3762249-Prymnesium_polylepis.1
MPYWDGRRMPMFGRYLQLREEAQVALLDHLRHVLLPPVVRRRVLLPQVDDQVEVAPHVVVVPDVLLEAAALSVERETVDAADEADVVHVVLLGEVLGAQLACGSHGGGHRGPRGGVT